MQIIRSSTHVIRSIRQISLAREWIRLRGDHVLPNLSDFCPDQRAGDEHELSVTEVVRGGGGIRYLCHQTGKRVEEATGQDSNGRYLDELLPLDKLTHVTRILSECIDGKVPIYSHVKMLDADERPVTLEHLHLPFSANHRDTLYVVAMLQAFSEDGQYRHAQLFRQPEDAMRQIDIYIIDPERAEAARQEAGTAFLEI